MRILTVNTGSTSVRLGLFDTEADAVNAQRAQRYVYGEHPPEEILREFFAGDTQKVDAASHRVVHGGELTDSCIIDAAVERRIQQLGDIAPLHNPLAHTWIRACRIRLGADVPQVAVFDTAFFARLPDEASHYALPSAMAAHLGIRRYGFHGIAHEAMWRRWCALRPDLPSGGRLFSLQLGGGCSAAALLRGAPRDTSMGFSPSEGLVMATRAGDLDPGIVTYLVRREHFTAQEIERLINRESGLLGVSGLSGDVEDLLKSDAPAAHLALAIYVHRIRKYLGAYLVELGGFDGIVIGGGVGEHLPELRERIFADLQWAGIRIDTQANRASVEGESVVSADDSDVEVRVMPVREEQRLAEEAVALLHGTAPAA